MSRVANQGASGQVLVISQSTISDQIKDDGEYEAFKELKYFNFLANKKRQAISLKSST